MNHLAHYPALANAAASWRWQPDADCLAGKNILVTGASSGIGEVAAKTFASFGANVILLGRDRARLESVFDWVEAHTKTQATIVPCDLEGLGDDNTQALAKAIEDGYGQLHGLLHNASFLGPLAPIGQYPTDAWTTAFNTNVRAGMMLSRDLLPLLLLPEQACLIFTSSSVGRQGRAFWGAYAASKFATEGLMQTMADELEQTSQVCVASLNPGGTRTPMRAKAYPAEDPATLPLPEDHMDLYLYLFSQCPTSAHGQAIDARQWQAPTV